jgi:hypothetical protein
MDGKATIALPAWAPAAAGAHSRGVDRLLMRPASDVAVRVRRGHVRAGVDPIVLSARRSSADTELLIASRQLFGLWLRKEIYAIDRNQNRRSPHLTMVWTLKKPKLCGPKDSIPTIPRSSRPHTLCDGYSRSAPRSPHRPTGIRARVQGTTRVPK